MLCVEEKSQCGVEAWSTLLQCLYIGICNVLKQYVYIYILLYIIFDIRSSSNAITILKMVVDIILLTPISQNLSWIQLPFNSLTHITHKHFSAFFSPWDYLALKRQCHVTLQVAKLGCASCATVPPLPPAHIRHVRGGNERLLIHLSKCSDQRGLSDRHFVTQKVDWWHPRVPNNISGDSLVPGGRTWS